MKINRRAFLEDVAVAAGLVFVGCCVDGEAAQGPQAAAGSRRRVVVKGRRIKTVDVHAHCAMPKATALLRRPNAAAGNDGPLTLDGQTLADRIGVMDAQGIDVAVLSINPNWYDAETAYFAAKQGAAARYAALMPSASFPHLPSATPDFTCYFASIYLFGVGGQEDRKSVV